MGKKRTARRNPPLTVSELAETPQGWDVEHSGDRLTVESCVYRGGLRTWYLVSGQGVEYSAIEDHFGGLSVGVTGRVLSLA